MESRSVSCVQRYFAGVVKHCNANGGAMVVKVHHLVAGQPSRGGLVDWLFLQSERLSIRLLHRHADLVLCTTPPVAADYHRIGRELGLYPSQVLCTGYGIDLDEIAFEPDTPKEYDAVILGRLHEHEGILDVPEDWGRDCARRAGARLLMIGEGPHRDELQRLLSAAGLASQVTLTGSIPEREKNALLTRCRLGLSLSREEGWGLSITGFLATGLPVVAMELPVFRAVFGDRLQYVAPGDTAGLANRLIESLDDPHPRRAEAAENRRFVERYDYRSVASREILAIEDAVRRRRAKG